MVGTLVGAYRCATSWCDLDLTFNLAYLMLFHLSAGISDTILSGKMGKELNVHTNVRGHFGMVEQYRKYANHNSTMRNVHV